MRVLIACEFSGIVRDAFLARGHDAWSCDLLPTERNGPHIQDDVLLHLNDGWDLMIAHPPCTHLCTRGAWHCKRRGDEWKIDEAVYFFRQLYASPVPKVAVENPVGILSSRWRKADQYIQPYQFGHRESKKTGLWLRGLPRLKPTVLVLPPEPEFIDRSGKRRYFVDKFSSACKDRALQRSKTFQGIADAMAVQWGA